MLVPWLLQSRKAEETDSNSKEFPCCKISFTKNGGYAEKLLKSDRVVLGLHRWEINVTRVHEHVSLLCFCVHGGGEELLKLKYFSCFDSMNFFTKFKK